MLKGVPNQVSIGMRKIFQFLFEEIKIIIEVSKAIDSEAVTKHKHPDGENKFQVITQLGELITLNLKIVPEM